MNTVFPSYILMKMSHSFKNYISLKYLGESILFSQRLNQTFSIVVILKGRQFIFTCVWKLCFYIYFAFCAHIMINLFEKNVYMFLIFFSFSLCVLEQSMMKEDAMVTLQQMDRLWQRTSGKQKNALLLGSALWPFPMQVTKS